MTGSFDWRYIVTYEGVVSAVSEDDARTRALEDVDNGKLPVVEVEREDEGE